MKRTVFVLLASGLVAGCGAERVTGNALPHAPSGADRFFVAGGIPVSGDEGSPVTFGSSSSLDVADGPLSVEWDFGDGSPHVNTTSATQELSVTHTWADNQDPSVAAVYHAHATVTDASGNATETIDYDVTINNLDPSATLVAPATVNAGANFAVQLDSPSDPSPVDLAAGFSYTFDCDDGNGMQSAASSSVTCPGSAPGWRTITALMTDKDGGSAWRFAYVEVVDACIAPGAATVTAPADPVQLGSAVNVSVSFTDAPDAGTNVTLLWSDGVTSTATPTNGQASFSRTMSGAGVYSATATVSNGCGSVSASTAGYVVVFDPSAGFVTGGGWIDAAPGSYTADPSLSGKTTFGFVAKYQKGANVPTGNTEFQFHANGLDFKSSSYDWLVIAGSRAQYKGSGTIKGRSGSFSFLLTAIDGGPGGANDAMRMKILDANGGVVFDNKQGANDTGNDATQLAGGSISIKKQ